MRTTLIAMEATSIIDLMDRLLQFQTAYTMSRTGSLSSQSIRRLHLEMVPEFLGRIRGRERCLRHRTAEEAAQRLPAVTHLIDEQSDGRHGGAHVLQLRLKAAMALSRSSGRPSKAALRMMRWPKESGPPSGPMASRMVLEKLLYQLSGLLTVSRPSPQDNAGRVRASRRPKASRWRTHSP